MYEVISRHLEEQPALVVTGKMSAADIKEWIGNAFSMVYEQIERRGLVCVGMPFARYRPLDDQLAEFEIEAGFPIATTAEGEGEVVGLSLPGGPVALVTHIGPYEQMKPAYEAIFEWIRDHRATPNGAAWEVYHSDPMEQPDPATWRTEIIQPYTVL